jgi:ATP-dependent Clp protease, protease subunit
MPNLVPIVLEKTANGERSYDIYSRLLKDRIIMMDTDVNEHSASLIVSQMLFLESESDQPINFYINSPGGSVTAGLGIYDTMQFIKAPVHTFIFGQAASMGSLLAQAGEAGHRYMMPHARHMIHQPSGGTQGMVTDMAITLKEIERLKIALTEIYVKHNSKGKVYSELERDMERDTWFTAQQALDYGLIDQIVEKR